MTHTPAPWIKEKLSGTHKDSEGRIIMLAQQIITQLTPTQLTKAVLDAEKVASYATLRNAAPELLEVLKDALVYMINYKKCDNVGLLIDMQAAINKAEGK